ncbi:hypothetical protein BKA64DRAFT_207146 [Cadophora sp. MPI-SDFR-AT-0126]|nr:hypothetical protein BKA64DRAFT_207146 [Leotiomycetes sp. MPI-SDFR-AT-0126]
MAPTTVLDYLCRPNPPLYSASIAPGTLTVNDRWIPIEGVRPWEDFRYDILYARYKSMLSKTIPEFDPCSLIHHAHFDEVAGEDSIEALVAVNNFLPVSNALHKTSKGYYGKGSKFFSQQSDGSPDWGVGDGRTKNDGLATFRNFCPGDIKSSSKWDSDGLLEIDWSNYLDSPQLINKARPLEQAQHYGIHLGTRYAWILTDKELVVIRITNSEDGVEAQTQRPSRDIQHRRVLSDISTASTAFSGMSLDHSAYSGRSGSSSGMNPAPLEIARISWAAGNKREMTINLALFFIAQLAFDDRSISSSYPPLKPSKHTLSGSVSSQTSSRTSQAAAASNKYWTPSKGIKWDVIEADITIYIPGATVEECPNNGVAGYLIDTTDTVDKEIFSGILLRLKADTKTWQNEGDVAYRVSKTHKYREYVKMTR